MAKVLSMMVGLLAGAAVGGLVTILVAPRSGVETRSMIQARIENIKAEGRHAAEERRQELEAEFERRKKAPPSA